MFKARRQATLKLHRNLDAEIDEGADLRRWMLARRVESEEREALAVPVRKEVDQDALGEQLPHAPANDLGDARAGDALRQHRFGMVKVSGPVVGTSTDSLPRTNSHSNGRPV
jgi:hypothetical protein